MTPIVSIESVTKTYGRGPEICHALNSVSFSIEPGEAVALMGPSGCGKSTLLNILGLLILPDTGVFLIDGSPVPVQEKARAHLRNTCFGYLHQDFAVIDDLTVFQNVVIPLEYAHPRIGKKERKTKVKEAIDQVGLQDLGSRKVGHLSGGQRQRVAIARALINQPQLVLADEPTAALDATTGTDIMKLILSVRDRDASVLLATHDERVAEQCDHIIRMDYGTIIQSGNCVLPAPVTPNAELS